MMEPEIKEILLENDRRKRIIGAVFDPVSGEGSIGKRIIVEIRDFIHRKQWLPTAMLEEPLLKDILKAGDIKGYLLSKGKGMSHKEVSDRLIRLRCLHDFPFWAASFAYIKCKGGVMMCCSASTVRNVSLWNASKRCVSAENPYAWCS